MLMPRIVVLGAAVALTGIYASAFAQGTSKMQRSAASIECSNQADAKGLHGKARKHFRSKCMRDMAKAGKTGKSTHGYR